MTKLTFEEIHQRKSSLNRKYDNYIKRQLKIDPSYISTYGERSLLKIIKLYEDNWPNWDISHIFEVLCKGHTIFLKGDHLPEGIYKLKPVLRRKRKKG